MGRLKFQIGDALLLTRSLQRRCDIDSRFW